MAEEDDGYGKKDDFIQKKDNLRIEQSIPLDDFLDCVERGIFLCGNVEGIGAVIKHEQKTYNLEQYPDKKALILDMRDNLSVPILIASDLLSGIYLTHPTTFLQYYNSKGALTSIKNVSSENDVLNLLKNKNSKLLAKYSDHARNSMNNFGKLAKVTKFLGYFSIALDAGGYAYEIFYNPEGLTIEELSKKGIQVGVNTIFTVVGLCGGPVGAVVSVIYFTVDAIVPGGWQRLGKNQYDMYMEHVDKESGVMMAPWLFGK